MLVQDPRVLLFNALVELRKSQELVKKIERERDFLLSRLQQTNQAYSECLDLETLVIKTNERATARAKEQHQIVLKDHDDRPEKEVHYLRIPYFFVHTEGYVPKKNKNLTTGSLTIEKERAGDITNLEKYKLYSFITADLAQVLESIYENKPIEGILIKEKMKDPFFQFETLDNPELSLRASKAISRIVRESNRLDPITARGGREKQKKTADEYASNIFDIVKEAKEKGINTFRATVDYLNENQIPTFRGGKWHLKTLQDLHKRWKELGLDESTPN